MLKILKFDKSKLTNKTHRMIKVTVTPVYKENPSSTVVDATKKTVKVFGLTVFVKTIHNPTRVLCENEIWFHPSM